MIDPQSASPQTEAEPRPLHGPADRLDLERAALLVEAALRLARRLRDGGLDAFAEGTGTMTRASPLAFFSGSILIGVAAARVFKASGERSHASRATPF